MASDHESLLGSYGTEGDADGMFELAAKMESLGEPHLAATAYDRAFGLKPHSNAVAAARRALLDRLAVVEHGIRFRYVPGGSFLMGSADAEPDERPVHPVRLNHYWLSETPVSWWTFCDLMDWEPPPYGRPRGEGSHFQGYGSRNDNKWAILHLLEENKVRLQYCEDATATARGWFDHATEFERGGSASPAMEWASSGEPLRRDPLEPWRYNAKPMVAVSWQDAEAMCERSSTAGHVHRLPTEAEWEKAARGGLIGCRYPWGDDPPTRERCDFDRFEEFSILPVRRFPSNGYGLYAMSGCVWEWTCDWYDSEFYRDGPAEAPRGPAQGQERVLRGGSWADCADVVTVSFRMSRASRSWREGTWGKHLAPNIGFRICRVERDTGEPGARAVEHTL